MKSHKLRIYPTDEQKVFLEKHFGAMRFVWNTALEYKKMAYEMRGVSISTFDISKELTQIKKDPEYAWLAELNADSFGFMLANLDKAYKAFFARVKKGETAGFPRFKSKHSHQSFQFRKKSIDLVIDRIHLPKLSEGIKIVLHTPFFKELKAKGEKSYYIPNTITLSKNKAEQYFVSFYVEDGSEVEEKPFTDVLGLDMGVKVYAYCSDGSILDNPSALKKHQDRLSAAQRKLAKMSKGSNRWQKQKLRIAKIYNDITNYRSNYIHNISAQITKGEAYQEYSDIAIEDLKLKNMTKSSKGDAENHGKMVKQKSGLNRVILDRSFGEFKTQLEYKCKMYGKRLHKIDPKYTSQLCSECGHTAKENRQTQELFLCVACGHTENADHNASKNIREKALKVLLKEEVLSI